MKTDRIQLKYRLRFSTPFHCGTGLRAGFIDRPVVRDAKDNVYVPGSTFKGAIRHHCEQLSRFYIPLPPSGSSVHLGSSRTTPLILSMEKASSDFAPGSDIELCEQRASLSSEDLQAPVTMVTRLFGSRNRPGLLFFDDARQAEEGGQQYESKERMYSRDSYRSIQTDIRMQMRLDRPTQTTLPETLSTSEFSLKELVLYGSICGWLTCTALVGVEGEPSYSLLLLLAGLCMLAQLGGSKSTGKGQCVCEIIQLSMNNQEFPHAVWLAWLDHLDMLTFYSKDALQEEEV